jgi:hypothetical protein
MLNAASEDLNSAYEASDLPEQPAPEEFFSYLKRVRVLELAGLL